MESLILFVTIIEKVCAFLGMVTITLSIAFILLAVKWSKEDDKDERHSKN